MRRLSLTLLVAALLAPAALAVPWAAGDGTLAGSKINGTVWIRERGAIWGQLGAGTIEINDSNPLDTVKVSPNANVKLGSTSNTIVYWGKDIRFQLTGSGPFVLRIDGKGLDFSAVGKGTGRFDGSDIASSTGSYAVGDAGWQPVPVVSTTVQFPAAASPPTTTSP
jgi:hypothetical protein